MSKPVFRQTSWVSLLIEIAVPGGWSSFSLPVSSLAEYEKDPIAFSADLLGMTSEQYLHYLESDGTVQCSGKSANGKQCKHRSKQCSTHRQWLELDRSGWVCSKHQGGQS